MATEGERVRLFEEFAQATSRQSAEVLMSYLPPEGWADLATKADLRALGGELRAEMAEGFGEVEKRFGDMERRFGQVEKRFGGIDGRFGGIERRFAEMERNIANLRLWYLGSMLTLAAILIGAMRLFQG
jgi:hypothetical protein